MRGVSGAYAGIGFAVPVDTINRVVPRLIGFGRYVRPSLGISANDDVSRLVGVLDTHEFGDRVTLTVRRGGVRLEVPVTLNDTR